MIEIRKGTQEDVESFLHLLQSVKQEMEQEDWLYLDPPEVFRKMMKDGIMQIWLATDNCHVAGAFSILIPGLESYNYGYDLDFCKEDLLQVVHMDTAVVAADYRGLGLQYRLMQAAEEEIRRMGNGILLCTVHPENRFSLNNILRQGYAIQKETPKYGSVRYILRKDIF